MEMMALTPITTAAGEIRMENQYRALDIPGAEAILGITILILLLLATFTASGQEQKKAQLRDTTAITLQLFDQNAPPIKLSLFPPPWIQAIPEINPRLFYQTSTAPSRQFTWDFKEKLDLTAPLKLQLADQEKYQTWRMILGSIQAGGTAYILYQHLKKYGLK